jgi:hypothetical protein
VVARQPKGKRARLDRLSQAPGLSIKLVRVLLPINQEGTTSACVAVAAAPAKAFRIEVQGLYSCAQRLDNFATLSAPPFDVGFLSPEPDPIRAAEVIELARTQMSLAKRRATAWWKKAIVTLPEVATSFASAEGPVDRSSRRMRGLPISPWCPSVSEGELIIPTRVRPGQ